MTALNRHLCECGHSVADHRAHFHSSDGFDVCSVPDCGCQQYERQQEPKTRDHERRRRLAA